MYQKVLHFVKYNNAFTIIFVLVFFGFGISFAASPEIREGVYTSTETVASVDNSFIVAADLDNFNFNLRIKAITEDEKNYYAVYSYQTIAISDGFWQKQEAEKTLTVSKEALGGKDLGLYLAEELGENINYELSYLKRVQKLEKEKGESQKIVTTEYSGLIGKLLDPDEKVIDGYDPVIPEPAPQVPVEIKSNPAEVVVSVVPEHTESVVITTTENTTETITENIETVEISTSSSTEPSTESDPETFSLPAPEEMINEELVQEVVEELLQNQENSTSADPIITEDVAGTTTESVGAEAL